MAREVVDDDGRTVIRAVVQARLLGIRLLSLDARVVLGPATVVRSTPPDQALLWSGDHRPTRARRAVTANGAEPGTDLARAVALLEDSTKTLARSRRDPRA